MDEKGYSSVIDARQELAKIFAPHANEPDDECLIQAVADGNDQAMALLYERYNTLLYSLALRMTASQQVAEDLLQETFLAIWRHAASYAPQSGSVRGWLLSIMRHRIIDYLRSKRSRGQDMPLEEAEWNEELAFPDVWEDAWHSIERSLIRECLGTLPSEQRSIIELVYFHDWTQLQIATRLHIPLGTVKSRLRLALLRLKREFERRGTYENVMRKGVVRCGFKANEIFALNPHLTTPFLITPGRSGCGIRRSGRIWSGRCCSGR